MDVHHSGKRMPSGPQRAQHEGVSTGTTKHAIRIMYQQYMRTVCAIKNYGDSLGGAFLLLHQCGFLNGFLKDTLIDVKWWLPQSW